MTKSRKCIFCGAGKVTKEHFWPEWAHEFLPQYPDSYRTKGLISSIHKGMIPVGRKNDRRQGHTWNLTFRAVCSACNNGWMNQLESAARSTLTSLATGSCDKLSISAAANVSRWITMKIMVSEQDKDDLSVISHKEREAFKQRRVPPENFRIWIADCQDQGWQAGYVRHALALSHKPSSGLHKNTHSVAFGFGRLYVYVLHSHLEVVVENINFDPEVVLPLYPAPSKVSWPPRRVITGIEGHMIASALNKFISTPNVKWIP